MYISRCVCLFMIYSFMGWIYESIFCTVNSGKWENRGFLYGPACPIYGTGALAVSLLMELTSGNGIEVGKWQIFLVSVIGSAILEYATSWTLEKLFHATWWDYSHLPLNLHGRISLLTSLGFGLGGLLVADYIAPFTMTLVDGITPICTELLAFAFVFVFAVDLTLTVTVLYHFDRMVVRAENTFNHSMETIVDSTVQRSNRFRKSIMKKGHLVNEQINSMSGIMKGTLRRVKAFRARDDHRQSVKNSYLSKLRNFTRRRN